MLRILYCLQQKTLSVALAIISKQPRNSCKVIGLFAYQFPLTLAENLEVLMKKMFMLICAALLLLSSCYYRGEYSSGEYSSSEENNNLIVNVINLQCCIIEPGDFTKIKYLQRDSYKIII